MIQGALDGRTATRLHPRAVGAAAEERQERRSRRRGRLTKTLVADGTYGAEVISVAAIGPGPHRLRLGETDRRVLAAALGDAAIFRDAIEDPGTDSRLAGHVAPTRR